MQRPPLFWILIIALLLVGAAYLCPHLESRIQNPASPTYPTPPRHHSTTPLSDYSKTPLRLTNTPKSLTELARSDHAILLENALLDTDQPTVVPIPENLRTPPPSPVTRHSSLSYIVQCIGPPNANFRNLLTTSGASIIAYIPNNAYLVRATAATAQSLATQPQIQAVLPYEPYYKLKSPLLELALDSPDSKFNVQSSTFKVPFPTTLNVLIFPDARASTLSALKQLNLEILSEDQSPFGPVLKLSTLHSPLSTLPTLAQLPGVQEIEPASERRLANDLTRATIAVSANTTTTENYLGLTGSNVTVNVNDTGVDASHPDFGLRVSGSITDTNGHGTHIAGIIAGNGSQSATVTNAPGSITPAVPGQFRGKAPAAKIISVSLTSANNAYLRQVSALSNALISNNSWTYSAPAYDLAAASYDAAVRDALPEVTGSQPVLFVFPAGNAGALNEQDSNSGDCFIPSPATAKNVITVGATTAFRHITNKVRTCSSDGTNVVCVTNQPWLAATSSADEVAAFSRRGNVGIGIEGEFGRFKPDVVAPGSFVVSTRSSTWDQTAYYHPSTNSDYAQVLSNLNTALGPFYRYESGASMAAAAASGTLALMQEFLEQRLGGRRSPALMKALLINGARSLGGAYDFNVATRTNFQGWGRINLPNSIPATLTNLNPTATPMLIFDQSPTNALATGQSRTRLISLSPDAQGQPLRVTLVWTDPPGNPAAGLKLVNDLDLAVTNLDTGDVFFGNDIPTGQGYNSPWTNGPPNVDYVNNVENVYLAPPLGTNYSITVIAHRVNVNAVTAQTNDVVQDYALVISSGDGQFSDALALMSESPGAPPVAADVTFLTNALPSSPGVSGAILKAQRAGANAPLLAGTNGLVSQWRFYVLTNELNFTNALFATFLPPDLSISPAATGASNLANATRPEADIDLYVSTDPGLTNLYPLAIAAADKSLGRGGTEFVFYTNVAPGAVFYAGVKSEDQQAAEFGFLGVFSESPFGILDDEGNQMLRGFPLPSDLLPATLAGPGVSTVIAFASESARLRRVIVTNSIAHKNLTNLVATLSHGQKQVVLDSHSPGAGGTNQTWIYEDNGAGDIAGSQPSDGPGSLRDFIGDDGLGLWLLTVLDATPTNAGHLDDFSIRLEPQTLDVNALVRTVVTNTFTYDAIDVPLGATNLTVCLSSNAVPVELYVRLGALPTRAVFDKRLVINPPGDCLSLALSDLPPLQPGRCFIGAYNPDVSSQDFVLQASVLVDPASIAPISITSAAPVLILDDALTRATLLVTNNQQIAAVAVGLRVVHPRVSDLAFQLFSPSGTRVLLCEDRGGTDAGGLGGDVLVTNVMPQVNSGDFNANTNVIEVGQTNGTLIVDYDFFALPDTLHVYYDGALIFDSGSVSNAGQFVVNFGPGISTEVTIVMNEGNNTNMDTAWEYKATVVSPRISYLVFTEASSSAPADIKFATPPFNSGSLSNLFCLPEESLQTLADENALGTWTLDMLDSRAGATVPPPQLVSWQLMFIFKNSLPPPVITAAQIVTNSFCLTWTSLPGGQYYVQGKTNLTDANWTIVSPAVIAPDHQTTWCLPLPSNFHYFRVQQ